MKLKHSGILPSLPTFAEELTKIEKGQPSVAHLIFGLGGLLLAMYLGNKSSQKTASVSTKGINPMSKGRPTKQNFDSGFDNSKGPQMRVVG
jgi:hypothetical protein